MKSLFGEKVVYAGKVTAVDKKTEGKMILDISVESYDREAKENVTTTEKITFRDSEKVNFTTRLSKLDLVGSYIAVEASEYKGTMYARAFVLSGGILEVRYKKKDGSDTSSNVYFGKIYINDENTSITCTGKTVFKVSGSVRKSVDGEKYYEYVNITFWNDEGGEKNTTTATNACKVLKNGDIACVVLGKLTDFTNKKGDVSKNATGYRFEVLERGKASDAAPDEEKKSSAPAPSVASTVFGDDDEDEDEDEYCGF